MDKRKQLIEKVIENIYELRKRISIEMHLYFTQANITHSQGLVLNLIKKKGIINIRDLASLLSMTSSAATQLVDSLVNKGFLIRKRNPQDRRTLKIELTEKAQKQFEILKSKSFETLSSIFNILDDEELSKYYEINNKLLANIPVLCNEDKKKESVRVDV
jgi:DNA-binding MarR family transcriptional regulator